MSSRRLDISSLLCSDETPQPPPTSFTSHPVSDPVILAPHLRRPVSLSPHRFDPLSEPSAHDNLRESHRPISRRSYTDEPDQDVHYHPPSPEPVHRHQQQPSPQTHRHPFQSRPTLTTPQRSILNPTQSPIFTSSPSTERFSYLPPRSHTSTSPVAMYPPQRAPSSSHSSHSHSPHSRPSTSIPSPDPSSRTHSYSHGRSLSHPAPTTTMNAPTTPPRPPPSGLDVLVQAASQERRRLSSGSDSYPRSSSPIDDDYSSAFPLRRAAFPPPSHAIYAPANRVPSPPRARVMSHSEVHTQRSPFELRLASPPTHTALPPVAYPAVDLDNRLHKRRRQSGSDSERPHLVPEEGRERSVRLSSPPAPLPSPFSHTRPHYHESLDTKSAQRQTSPTLVKPHGQVSAEGWSPQPVDRMMTAVEPCRQHSYESAAPRSGIEVDSRHDQSMQRVQERATGIETASGQTMALPVPKAKHKIKRERTASHDSEVLLQRQQQPKPATKKASISPPPPMKLQLVPTEKTSDGQRSRKRQEEDAHEWFLQHYAKASPPPPEPVSSQQVPPLSPPPPSPPPSPPQPAVAVQEPEDANSPEAALAALEHELDLASASEPVEAAKAEEEPADSFADVDAELLMLVDDKPSLPARKTSTSKLPEPPAPIVPPTPTALKISPPPFPSPTSKMGSAANTPVLERGSMPPPANVSVSARASSVDPSGGSKKKKEASGKTASKPKAKPAAKPRAKTKATAKIADTPAAAAAAIATPSPTKAGGKGQGQSTSSSPKKLATERSRSVSVVPGAGVDAEMKIDIEKDDEEKMEEDDKLYCVCKTRYDEDKVMIACDLCDEWYHTQCVEMPDLEIDLVDQFICPPCIAKNPESSRRTTYKPRCLFGLQHPDPSSPSACHKPSRGALSKYCSEECGIKAMQVKIRGWTDQGGQKEKLWDSVKLAEPREGVTVCAENAKIEVDGEAAAALGKRNKRERDVEHLKRQLEAVVSERERLKKQMEVVQWRERLMELASRRSEAIDTCGWDQRLCFSDEEMAEAGVGALESYEEKEVVVDVVPEESMQADREWWCLGKKKCDRHPGWQKLRAAEVSFEKDVKETALSRLTHRERDIRKRMEDIMDPYSRGSGVKDASPNGKASHAFAPSKHANGPNVQNKTKVNGEQKKGKKKT